jgi:hypothetical protein
MIAVSYLAGAPEPRFLDKKNSSSSYGRSGVSASFNSASLNLLLLILLR